ncbi:LuxR C-terminal-related transcriptional regulator [Bradyrhizobium sp. NP1]|uniref:LuxR C-terminal-related transcriptional regulator n=1 Tax=Bradyrhizobium sp. NP1 TaxID=3049772 RepID=UPI0025A54866|nr:LuxR C-terminal-related transcriptional regulator [Bradyrhizobium sp. NP1]WJR77312.1 LuxR C-terminal-related transcriptional regulator [Bradyrhizobium sp. NP1]
MRRRYSFATVVIGKNSLRREGLAGILRSAHFRILASVSCADDLLTSKVQPEQTLFLIIHNGDDFDAAIEQIELFKERHSGSRIALVADHYRLTELVSAFRAGATGYFVDLMSCDAFIKSLELVMMGETVFPPAFLARVLDSESEAAAESGPRGDNSEVILGAEEETIAPQLSPREKSILHCLIEGDSNKCIARKIDIAEATVKVHVKAILRKIRVQNRTQAAIWGMNNRFLARLSSSKFPNGSADAAQHSGNGMAEVHEIKRVEAKPALGAVNYHSNHIHHADRLIRKDSESSAMIRLRK